MATNPKALPGGGVVNQAAVRGRTPVRGTVTTTKSYVVTSHRKVGGVTTGGTVSLTLTAGQERDMIEAGHIRLAP